MIPVNLILTIVGLLFILILLVALYVWSSKSKPTSNDPKHIETFESLSEIIKNRASSSRELHHAVDVILNRFGTMTSHTIGKYKALLETLCVHPHTNSQLILRFEKTLRTNNPNYSHDIEQSLARGLAARG